jgi:hypothetical protein
LNGGAGYPDIKDLKSFSLETPPTIKRSLREKCYSNRPCSYLWNTHSELPDLRRHLHYLFGISWRAISRLVGEYGVDHINQNIHETREFIRSEMARGEPIRSLAGSFLYCMDAIKDAEPELSEESELETADTIGRGLSELAKFKVRKPADDPDKYLDEYQRRRGNHV